MNSGVTHEWVAPGADRPRRPPLATPLFTYNPTIATLRTIKFVIILPDKITRLLLNVTLEQVTYVRPLDKRITIEHVMPTALHAQLATSILDQNRFVTIDSKR
ncbi:hypothetical protein EVAR_30586_1 [Eumeta japonica]|uniref:Uncharacterized protein n=1 Tax=Eumeta variegata TaxID=151549 RepID=A0A4C1W807_EUMVA|nr:hypothetical protein EVAR_30586_1 [Eumeta japonica]